MSGTQVILASDGHAERLNAPFSSLRRMVFFLLVALSTLAGANLMMIILQPNGLSGLEFGLLLLFSISFAWIVYSFWSAFLGFLLTLFKLDPLTLKPLQSIKNSDGKIFSRTAVVMPVYNEDTQRVLAGFEANMRSLHATGRSQYFDFFLLSDTQDPEIAKAEREGWWSLKKRLGKLGRHAYYRRRERNHGRKVGNLSDFCDRWGQRYEYMIVLDADSIMTGKCMVELVQAMDHNPSFGLVQTVPLPVRQQTLFGRFLQFAGTLYSPMLAAGMAFWQTDSANYWGHNAIIRIAPFVQHCALPKLRAKRGPFSGEILSHDFVEAALLRRAGWQVVLRSDIGGSYEELPSNILDYAVRDRRWAQGNIQHLALLVGSGYKFINRLHMFFGAVAYMSSLVWMFMLALSSVDAVQRSLNSNQYFSTHYQLFPTWHVAKTEQIVSLFLLTIALLFLPKVMGVIVGLWNQGREFGGGIRLFISAILEAVFAVLIAPVMMVYHSYFVLGILLGRKVGWNAQPRDGRRVSWRESLGKTSFITLMALAWGVAMYFYTPQFFWWLTPVLIGLLLAGPLVKLSSGDRVARWLSHLGLLAIPAELQGKVELPRFSYGQ